nr:hypothetical protein Itr_chr08CG12650 [Ipomoea trifida]
MKSAVATPFTSATNTSLTLRPTLKLLWKGRYRGDGGDVSKEIAGTLFAHRTEEREPITPTAAATAGCSDHRTPPSPPPGHSATFCFNERRATAGRSTPPRYPATTTLTAHHPRYGSVLSILDVVRAAASPETEGECTTPSSAAVVRFRPVHPHLCMPLPTSKEDNAASASPRHAASAAGVDCRCRSLPGVLRRSDHANGRGRRERDRETKLLWKGRYRGDGGDVSKEIAGTLFAHRTKEREPITPTAAATAGCSDHRTPPSPPPGHSATFCFNERRATAGRSTPPRYPATTTLTAHHPRCGSVLSILDVVRAAASPETEGECTTPSSAAVVRFRPVHPHLCMPLPTSKEDNAASASPRHAASAAGVDRRCRSLPGVLRRSDHANGRGRRERDRETKVGSFLANRKEEEKIR